MIINIVYFLIAAIFLYVVLLIIKTLIRGIKAKNNIKYHKNNRIMYKINKLKKSAKKRTSNKKNFIKDNFFLVNVEN